ncbi:MAG: imidazole glycerol phosphate synthase subunit HisH [Oscillospiraceae bacterium]|jgi:glutamine amidotransferase|nr:imidazole glycerol phosphate synthase subunit HisH [Oscillospiraceae bacterium]
MIAIIDYGAGNIFSIMNALNYIGAEYVLTNSADVISDAHRLILPGVGAFPEAMEKLRKSGLTDIIKSNAKVKPLLGICLGMQMLFDCSYEFEKTSGLGLIPGEVIPLREMWSDSASKLDVPHMGWNKLEVINDCPLNIGEEYVYFVHSYAARCEDGYICAYCDYGGKVPALVYKDGVYGAQFHPEKSGEKGLEILRKFSNL